jgi:hypothetical protein
MRNCILPGNSPDLLSRIDLALIAALLVACAGAMFVPWMEFVAGGGGFILLLRIGRRA